MNWNKFIAQKNSAFIISKEIRYFEIIWLILTQTSILLSLSFLLIDVSRICKANALIYFGNCEGENVWEANLNGPLPESGCIIHVAHDEQLTGVLIRDIVDQELLAVTLKHKIGSYFLRNFQTFGGFTHQIVGNYLHLERHMHEE